MSKFRSAVRGVWNGPFYIGKLEKPIKLGEVVLKLLETVWRGGVLVCVVFIIGIAVGGSFASIEYFRTQNNSHAGNYDPSISFDGKLRVAIQYQAKVVCDDYKDRPIAATITNLTDSKITAFSWSFGAYVEGHSTNLVWGNPEAFGHSDYVIEPQGSVSFCQAIPPVVAERMQTEKIIFVPNSVNTGN